jgi:hypothetical protein
MQKHCIPWYFLQLSAKAKRENGPGGFSLNLTRKKYRYRKPAPSAVLIYPEDLSPLCFAFFSVFFQLD